MEDEHAALHMTDVFIVNTSCWCPQAFAFGSENAAVVPFKVDIAVIEGLENLDLEGLPLEKVQEGSDRHCPLAYSTGRKSSQKRKRFSFKMLRRAKDDPRAGL